GWGGVGNSLGGATVDLRDLSSVLDLFGEGSGGAAAGGRVAAVPEPAGLGGVGALVWAGLRRWRRGGRER
ncbi:MAG: PEP-CTERM sorting domain-containing protein, partial [Phycisphaerae bacterium]